MARLGVEAQRTRAEQYQSNRSSLRAMYVSLGVVVVVWASGGLGFAVLAWSRGTIADAGVFGDSFGMVNSLFTGLAFAAVLCALYIQRKDSLKAIHESTSTRLDQAHRELLAMEIEARGSMVVALAILVVGGNDAEDSAGADEKAREAIAALEKLIGDVGRLRTGNALDRSILGGDEIAARNFPGTDV